MEKTIICIFGILIGIWLGFLLIVAGVVKITVETKEEPHFHAQRIRKITPPKCSPIEFPIKFLWDETMPADFPKFDPEKVNWIW